MTEQLAKRAHAPFYTVECASRCQLVEFQKQEYEKARLNAIRARMAETEMEYRTREVIDGALYLLQKPLNVMTALSNNLQRSGCSVRTPGCMPMGCALDEALDAGHEAARTLKLSLPNDKHIPHAPVNINEAIRDCLIISADHIDACGIEVFWRASSDLPMILCDDITVRVLLRMLLDNAINAIGENGATAREVRVISRVGADRMVEVCIQDTGPGIDRAARTKVFEPFYTAWQAGPHHAGLGLAIARQIVADLHGDIEVRESNVRGSTICVSLPAC
ncbi:ATP-binding protein [uncultured Cohaesibacter sp.]|uniref:ATP-binding protein n=1 Tax=uncultured Cohaesibacter sp. TaxID=1002546 RepID=UPI0029C7F212|nr:ATP-binding protein [uncultured Cohaesibacter sp.]